VIESDRRSFPSSTRIRCKNQEPGRALLALLTYRRLLEEDVAEWRRWRKVDGVDGVVADPALHTIGFITNHGAVGKHGKW
jgi:hypothetical protein